MRKEKIEGKEGWCMKGRCALLVRMTTRITIFSVIIIFFSAQWCPCLADNGGIKIIEHFAAAACKSLDTQIKEREGGYRSVLLPFVGFEEFDSAKLVKYESDSNSDERFFYDCLFEKFILSEKFRIFTRNKLDEALAELKIQMKDIFDPATAKRVGKFVGADLIIFLEGYVGTPGYRVLISGNGVFRVKIFVIDIETAEVKAIWKKFVFNPSMAR